MPVWKILFFVLLVQTPVSLLFHWMVGSRIAWVLDLEGPAARVFWAGIGVMVLLLPAALFLTRARAPSLAGEVVSWIGFTWMGLVFLLLVTTSIGEIAVLATRGLGAAIGQDPSRPVRWIRTAAVVLGAVGTAWGVRSALSGPVVHEVQVPVAGLPREFEGYRIAHLSDTHVSNLLGKEWAASLALRVNAASPDLVVHTGDLVDGTVERLGPAAAELLRARGRDGSLFVTGNHETYSGVGDWIRFVQSNGWTDLRNRNLSILRGGAVLHVAGIPDAHERAVQGGAVPDVDAALRAIPSGEAVILLAHQPVQARTAQHRGIGLQLSGHTHGGQIWPFAKLVRLQQPLVDGLGRVGDVPVFTSRGAGFWGPPVRLFAPSEVPILVLHRSGS